MHKVISSLNMSCSVSDVHDFTVLCELTVLEQFTNSVPEYMATLISEQKEKKSAGSTHS